MIDEEEIYKAVDEKKKELGRPLEVGEIVNVTLEKLLEDEEGRKCYKEFMNTIRSTSKTSSSTSNEEKKKD